MDKAARLQILRRRGFTKAEIAAIIGTDINEIAEQAIDPADLPPEDAVVATLGDLTDVQLSGPPAAGDALRWNGSEWAPASVPTVTRVTELPGSPTDGQEIHFVADAANSVLWHLRWNDANDRWEFLGGPDLRAHVAAWQGVTVATWADLATVGPSLTPPATGTYDLTLSAHAGANTGTPRGAYMGVAIGAADPVLDDAVAWDLQAFANPEMRPANMETVRLSLTAGVALTAKYRLHTASGQTMFVNRQMRLRPVFIGGAGVV